MIGFDSRSAAAVEPPPSVMYVTHYAICGRVVFQTFLLDGTLYGSVPGAWSRHPQLKLLESAIPRSVVHMHMLDVSLISGVRCS